MPAPRLCAYLNALRERRGLRVTTVYLSVLHLDVNQSTVWRWFHVSPPSVAQLAVLAEVMTLSPAELYAAVKVAGEDLRA